MYSHASKPTQYLMSVHDAWFGILVFAFLHIKQLKPSIMLWHAMTKAFCRLGTQLIGILHQLLRTYRWQWILKKEKPSHFAHPRNGDSDRKGLFLNTLERPRARLLMPLRDSEGEIPFVSSPNGTDNLSVVNIYSSLPRAFNFMPPNDDAESYPLHLASHNFSVRKAC